MYLQISSSMRCLHIYTHAIASTKTRSDQFSKSIHNLKRIFPLSIPTVTTVHIDFLNGKTRLLFSIITHHICLEPNAPALLDLLINRLPNVRILTMASIQVCALLSANSRLFALQCSENVLMKRFVRSSAWPQLEQFYYSKSNRFEPSSECIAAMLKSGKQFTIVDFSQYLSTGYVVFGLYAKNAFTTLQFILD